MSAITRNLATKNSDKAVGPDGSNSPAGQFCAVNLAFQTSVGEESRARRLKFQSFQQESILYELLRVKSQAHRLVGVWAHAGHRAVIILILPYMSSLKLRPRPRWVLRNLKAVTNASQKTGTRMQSLSRRTAILRSKSFKIAVNEIYMRWCQTRG